MHGAEWSRAKVEADKRRTGGSTFRAAISNARNERTSPLWARAALFEHAAERARAAKSSAPARPSGLGVQQASAAPPCEASLGRLGLSGSVRFRSALPGRGRSEAERVRAANSNAPARPNPTEQSGAEQKLMPITDEQNTALFERMLWLLGRLSRHFSSILAPEQTRATLFEHSAAAGQARTARLGHFAAAGRA